MKHTKGDWLFGHNRGVFSGDVHIADISPCKSFDTTLANAKLISAAPDLLEACMWAVAFGKNGQAHDKVILEKLNNAIKKATT